MSPAASRRRVRVRARRTEPTLGAILALALLAGCTSSSRRGNRRGDEPPPPEVEALTRRVDPPKPGEPSATGDGASRAPLPAQPLPPEEAGAPAQPARPPGGPILFEVPSKIRLPRHNERSPLGTNLAYLRDYTGEYVFVDVFKQSRDWISGTPPGPGGQWEDKRKLDLDAQGWVRSLQPGQVARTLFFFFQPKIEYPSGDYIVLYDGEGELEFENVRRADSRPGRVVITADSSRGGFSMLITRTNPKNYLRNIRVIMPGGVCKADPFKACRRDADCGAGTPVGGCESFEANYRTQIFHPTFLDRTKTYSEIRFKDWMATDGSKLEGWGDRPKLDDARWTIKGVPIELIVELANRLHVHTWVNVPHKGKDDLAAGWAEYLRDHLDPDLRIYVEHTNEVWNGGMESSKYYQAKARESPVPGLEEFQVQELLYARRARELFRVFQRVLGERKGLVRVMGTHPAIPSLSDFLLSREEAYKEVDALAMPAYFGNRLGHPDRASPLRTMPMDGVMDQIAQEMRMFHRIMGEQAVVAKKHGVALVAYEGGQHLVALGPIAGDREINTLFDKAANHPRMKDLYLEHLAAWKNLGGQIFFHFLNTAMKDRYGRFGALDDLEQPRSEAPKFDALQEFIEKNPRWW